MNAPSAFSIEYHRQGSLLRAHVTGVNGTLETTMAYWMSMAEEVRRERPRSLLVVDDMEGEPPPPEQLAQFVQAMVGLGFEGVAWPMWRRMPNRFPKWSTAKFWRASRDSMHAFSATKPTLCFGCGMA
jgi:hypothetical protein